MVTLDLALGQKMQNLYRQLAVDKSVHDGEQIKTHINRVLQSIEREMDYLDGLTLSSDSKVTDFLLAVKETQNELKQLYGNMDELFMIFVMGMGSMGKSTLVNALIERDIAEINTKPCTWKIDLFKKTKEKEHMLFAYKRNKSKQLSIENGLALLEAIEVKTKKLHEEARIDFKAEKKKLRGNKEALKELQKDHNAKTSKKASDVESIQWHIKSESLLLNDFIVVDTPGLKQDIGADVMNSAEDFYFKSDGALWIVDADKLASKESTQLLEDSGDNGQEPLYKDKRTKVICVVNKIDKVRNRDGEEMVQRVIKKAEEHFGQDFVAVIPLSAKEAEKGIQENNTLIYEKSGMPELLKAININFLSSAKSLKLQSKLGAYNKLIADIYDTTISIKEALNGANDKRELLVNILIEELDEATNLLRSTYMNWSESYEHQVRNNITKYSEEIVNNRLNVSVQVKEKIFTMKEYNRKHKKFTKSISKQMIAIYKEQACESQFKKYKYIRQKAYKLPSLSFDTFDVEISYNTLTTDWFDASFNDGGIMMTAKKAGRNIRNFMFGDPRVKDLERKCRNHLDDMMTDSRRQFKNNLKQMHDQVKDSVSDIRESTFSELYIEPEEVLQLTQSMERIQSMLCHDIEEPYNLKVILGGNV